MVSQFNSFEIEMTKNEAIKCSHSGDCLSDVKELYAKIKIQNQLKRIPDTVLHDELKEYGAWTEEELQDRHENDLRILWISANNIREEYGI